MRTVTDEQQLKADELRDTENQVIPVLIATRGCISHFICPNGRYLTVEHDCGDPSDSCSVLRDFALENRK